MMERLKNCRYCGKKIDVKSNFKYYCSAWCRQHWHYEEQDDLFYVAGLKQEKCVVCGNELNKHQLKYCSKPCYFEGRYRRKKQIEGEDVKRIKRIKRISRGKELCCCLAWITLNF